MGERRWFSVAVDDRQISIVSGRVAPQERQFVRPGSSANGRGAVTGGWRR
jgi:hypothetical protein